MDDTIQLEKAPAGHAIPQYNSSFKQIFAFDTETFLIQDGLLIPQMVCLSYAVYTPEGPKKQGLLHAKFDKEEIRFLLNAALTDPETLIVAHNLAFDAAVCMNEFPETIKAWYDKGYNLLLEDTLLREKLLDVAAGHLGYKSVYGEGAGGKKKYGLGPLMGIDKEDGDAYWRLRYGTLYDIPLEGWAEGAVRYAVYDAVAAGQLWFKQLERAQYNPIPDSQRRARSSIPFQLMNAWGVRADPNRVWEKEYKTRQEYEQAKAQLAENGIVDGQKGTVNNAVLRNFFEYVANTQGISLPRTKTGMIQTTDAVRKMLAPHHPLVDTYTQFKKNEKVLTTYIPVLKDAANRVVNPSTDILKATGRTSYYRPNLQNVPRKGGLRQCFAPRPGHVYIICDYDSLEIRTLAQVLYSFVGGTTLKEKYDKDPAFDPHTNLASQILHIAYEEGLRRKKEKDVELKDHRQMSKAANFGLPGGMGAKKFIIYAKDSYGVVLTEYEANKLKKDWLKSIPEMRSYFNMINQITKTDKVFRQLFSGRVRGNVGYCDGANTAFQGLAADGALEAGYWLSRECYTGKSSPLYGCRPVIMIHDEYIIEAPENIAADAAQRVGYIMKQAMQKFCPDIPIECEPALAYCWEKDAEAVYDANGKLIPWTPEA